MLEREERKVKRSSVLSSMLTENKEESKARDRNPSSYKRNRGKDNSKAMSYYLREELIGAIALKSIKEGITKSDVVRLALENFLEVEMEELNILKNR